MFLTPILGADKKTMEHLRRVAAATRQNARHAAMKAAIAEKKQKVSDEKRAARAQRRKERVDEIEIVTRRRLDSFIRHPTARGAEMLAELAANPKIGKSYRAEAAEILLKWADGNFTHSKRRRRGKEI